MDETTNPETGVVDTPAEQDFSDFEKSLDAAPEPVEEEAPDIDEGDTPEEAPPAANDDFEEVEYEGKNYKLPKELKDAILRQSDYTRKTQEVAEMRRRLEPLVQQAEEVSQAETQAQSALAAINFQISQYENIDWQTWRLDDPQSALQAQVDIQTLLTQRSQVEQAHTQARQQRLSITAQETARRFEEGRKVLAEKIPDFASKAPKIAEYAMKEHGFTAQELGEVEDPRAFIILNRLMDLEAQVSKQQAAAKAQKTVEVQPVQTLKGNSGRTGPRADTNDFLAFEKLADQKIRTRR